MTIHTDRSLEGALGSRTPAAAADIVRTAAAAVDAVAVGLVHRPAGTPAVDRHWARSLVIRRARELHLHLLDVLELRDVDSTSEAVVSRRLNALMDQLTPVGLILITDGAPLDILELLAADSCVCLETTHPTTVAVAT